MASDPMLQSPDPVVIKTEVESPIESVGKGEIDTRLLKHYRKYISPQIIHILWKNVEDIQSLEDTFEQRANDFHLLRHAMMALSALSLAFQDGVQKTDALQHHQQAVSSLLKTARHNSDLSSEGALFTHFFLLLYKIAAAEQWQPNLWSPHLSHLHRIVLTLLESACILAKEEHVIVPILQFSQQLLAVAMDIRQLARTLRAEALVRGTSTVDVDLKKWTQRISYLQETLRRTAFWEAPDFISDDWVSKSLNLPPRALANFEQSQTLYYTTIIYSHTSMWAGRRAETSLHKEEIDHCILRVLRFVQSKVTSDHLQLRFIAFPLFLIGFAAESATNKMLALELMTSLELDSIGRSTKTIGKLLEVVYERQKEELLTMGNDLHVDWVEIMQEQGLQVTSLGI
ncbi:MAG: hypothetical protein M1814_001751 [Vezdaea aestivalis]|nr:MAG: hypothetical protein M1814_001751 [Vezdaea aestivalis]